MTLTQTLLTLKGHKNTIPSIAYFPDGKRMISGSFDKTARHWDLEAGKEIKKARDVHKQEIHAVGVSRDGRWVVTAGGELKVCEVETGIVRKFEYHSNAEIDCIDISADSTLLANGSKDCTVRIWNLETGNLVAGPFRSFHYVDAVRFSQSSKKLAVKSRMARYLEVWDVQSQKLDVWIYNDSWYYTLTPVPVFWTTKDKTIVTALFSATHNSVYEFDAATLETVGPPFKGHTNPISGLAISLDCALLASACNNIIKLWAFESRQLLASFDVLSTIHHLILSPNSHKLVYTTMRNNIYLCNTPPEILASIYSVPQVRTSAPRNIPTADSGILSLTPNQSTYEDPSNAPQSIPSHSLSPPPITFARHSIGLEPRTDRHAGTSCIQPTDIRPLTDRRQWPTLPPAQIPPAPCLHQLLPDPCELVTSSSHTDRVLPIHNDEPHNLLPEIMLPDLTKYITKDGEYPVARGGFGEIWKCIYHIDGRSMKVAVKALQVYTDDGLNAAKMKKTKRIMHELRICAGLEHANILPVYGYTYGFGPFLAIVSPWAENGNLTAYLERVGAALTLVPRFQILRDIIAGLQHLHANRIIHGDFTGPNVLIHGDGTACVADFGLSLMYSEVTSPSQASWTSVLKGNMRWMAPELLVEQEDGSQVRPSEQSDMYSFGGIMLQVLTNEVPYYYLSNNAAIILCIAKSQTPSRSRYPELPEQYWQFIEQCWSTDPWGRPSAEGAGVAIRDEFHSLSGSGRL